MTVTSITRPRVEGEREQEILEAVVALLLETGYDKLTFDAVAGAVHVSKATLYRKWPSKAELVVEAVVNRTCGAEGSVDTGSLRGDLLATACQRDGLTTLVPGLFAAMLPALHRDEELCLLFRQRFIDPKHAAALVTFARAQERGEIGPGADLERLAAILPALCIHETVVMGSPVGRDGVVALVDEVVLPACRATLPSAAAAASG